MFRWVVEVAKLCVYEGFHSCSDLVDPVLFVSGIGSKDEGFGVQAYLDVSIRAGGDLFFFSPLGC